MRTTPDELPGVGCGKGHHAQIHNDSSPAAYPGRTVPIPLHRGSRAASDRMNFDIKSYLDKVGVNMTPKSEAHVRNASWN